MINAGYESLAKKWRLGVPETKAARENSYGDENNLDGKKKVKEEKQRRTERRQQGTSEMKNLQGDK